RPGVRDCPEAFATFEPGDSRTVALFRVLFPSDPTSNGPATDSQEGGGPIIAHLSDFLVHPDSSVCAAAQTKGGAHIFDVASELHLYAPEGAESMQLFSAVLYAAMVLAPGLQEPTGYEWNKKSVLSVNHQVEFPGIVLEAGN